MSNVTFSNKMDIAPTDIDVKLESTGQIYTIPSKSTKPDIPFSIGESLIITMDKKDMELPNGCKIIYPQCCIPTFLTGNPPVTGPFPKDDNYQFLQIAPHHPDWELKITHQLSQVNFVSDSIFVLLMYS